VIASIRSGLKNHLGNRLLQRACGTSQIYFGHDAIVKPLAEEFVTMH
jgi:hypothetical protein